MLWTYTVCQYHGLKMTAVLRMHVALTVHWWRLSRGQLQDHHPSGEWGGSAQGGQQLPCEWVFGACVPWFSHSHKLTWASSLIPLYTHYTLCTAGLDMYFSFQFGFRKWKSHVTERPIEDRSEVVRELYSELNFIKPVTGWPLNLNAIVQCQSFARFHLEYQWIFWILSVFNK